MTVAARLALVLVALAALTGACGRNTADSGGSRRPTLQPVSLPSLSSEAEPVQQQIRERFAQLQAVLDRPDAPADRLAAAYGEMGKQFTAAEYYDEARACFENARALAPGDMRWSHLLGHVFRLENDPTRAAASFERALSQAPAHVPTLVWLGEMYLAQDRPEAAESVLTRARSLDSSSGVVLFALGRVALARQDFAQAVEHLERALTAGPHATRIHYPLALAYRGLGNQAKAEEHLRLRGDVDLPPVDPLFEEVTGLLQNAAAYETRGSQAIEARQWPEAVEHLRKAVELAPDNVSTRLNLGTALYMSGDGDGALAEYRAAIRLAPGLARAHFGIGVVLESRGRDREAIDAFSAAVQDDATYVEARFSLAHALRRSGRVRESLAHYEEILRANPAVSQASFGLAMGLVRLGRYQEARARLEDGVATFPDQLGFAHALARLLAAAPDDRVRDGSRALSMVLEVLKTEQTLAVAETMAMALAETGQFDEAIWWQREAIELADHANRGDIVARLTRNLRGYEAGQACRTPWADDDPVHRPAPSTE